MQIDRDTPPGRYLIRGTEASLIVERTATATGMRTIARPVDPTSAPPWSGWHLPLPDPIRIADTAIWTATRNPAGGAELIHIGVITSIEPVDGPSSRDIEDVISQMRHAFIAMGHPLTDNQVATAARVARGEITADQMRAEIIARARQNAPVTPLPGAADEETAELEGDEEWLSTTDEPDDR